MSRPNIITGTVTRRKADGAWS